MTSFFGYTKNSTVSSKDFAEIKWHLDTFIEGFVVSDSWKSDSILQDVLAQLQERYQLCCYPYHMICMDISHLSGGYTAAGISDYTWGLPSRRGYRKYRITSSQSDDYLSLRETMMRYFKLESGWLPLEAIPDLVMIDGGIWQLHVLTQLLWQYPWLQDVSTKKQFVALGKGAARSSKGKIAWSKEILYVLDKNNAIHEYPLCYDAIDRILITCRDEAHRFANRYRKEQMQQELTRM